MWGRANMAAVTLLLLLTLGWICVRANAEGTRSIGDPKPQQRPRLGDVDGDEGGAGSKPPSHHQQQRGGHRHRLGPGDVQAMLGRATGWLWARRDRDAGWGNDTHRALLALRLANLSREDNVPPPAGLEMRLSAKQMELEIVLLLWRHRELGSSPARLARYTLGLSAMCMDPRRFHGHDLIETLQHQEPSTEHEFALAALAACNAQAHVRKRHMRRLLDIAHDAQDHGVETVSMGIMALRCIVQDHRHRNLQHFLRKPSLSLARRQRPDGGFGDLRATALALQALEEVENEPLNNWNRSGALAWLAARQLVDGSFDEDVEPTAEAVLGMAQRGMSSVRNLDCGQGLTDSSPPRLATANGETALQPSRDGDLAKTSPVSATASSPSASRSSPSPGGGGSSSSSRPTTPEPTRPAQQQQQQQQQQRPSPRLVNVTYTLWVGSDVKEIYNLSLTAPKNETFYEVMVLAAQRSANFGFAAYEWPNGHYVHTLAGYKEEPMSYHYWLLYRLSSPPEPKSPPGNQLVAPGGVDDLQISEGEHYLFWYKKL